MYSLSTVRAKDPTGSTQEGRLWVCPKLLPSGPLLLTVRNLAGGPRNQLQLLCVTWKRGRVEHTGVFSSLGVLRLRTLPKGFLPDLLSCGVMLGTHWSTLDLSLLIYEIAKT